MHNTRVYIKVIICTAFMLSCFNNNPDTEVSPDTNTNGDNDSSEGFNVERNMPGIVEDLRRDIKNLKAELD